MPKKKPEIEGVLKESLEYIGNSISKRLKETGRSLLNLSNSTGLRYPTVTTIVKASDTYSINSLICLLEDVGLTIKIEKKEND